MPMYNSDMYFDLKLLVIPVLVGIVVIFASFYVLKRWWLPGKKDNEHK